MKFKTIMLILISLCNVSLQAVFINGSVYKRGGQFIIHLGDRHTLFGKGNLQQVISLKTELVPYNKEDILVIIEDFFSRNEYNYSHYNLKQKEIIDGLSNQSEIFPNILHFLCTAFLHDKVETINVDCRHLVTSYYGDEENKITLQDVEAELNSNIKHLKDNQKTIQSRNPAYKNEILNVFKNLLSESKIIEEKFQLVKTVDPITSEPSLRKKVWDTFYRSLTLFVDANILYHIITNPNKKIIIACSGAAHKKNAEKMLEQIGYKKVTAWGPDIKALESDTDHFEPMNVRPLFKIIEEKNRQEPDICAYCKIGKAPLKRCNRCKAILYCSRRCQLKDWKASHKHVCKKRQTNLQNIFTCAFCNTPKEKSAIKKCAQCKAIFYCSKKCQVKDWRNHRKVCQKK